MPVNVAYMTAVPAGNTTNGHGRSNDKSPGTEVGAIASAEMDRSTAGSIRVTGDLIISASVRGVETVVSDSKTIDIAAMTPDMAVATSDLGTMTDRQALRSAASTQGAFYLSLSRNPVQHVLLVLLGSFLFRMAGLRAVHFLLRGIHHACWNGIQARRAAAIERRKQRSLFFDRGLVRYDARTGITRCVQTNLPVRSECPPFQMMRIDPDMDVLEMAVPGWLHAFILAWLSVQWSAGLRSEPAPRLPESRLPCAPVRAALFARPPPLLLAC